MLALGGGTLVTVLLGAVAASLVLVPIHWYEADRAARGDTARCALADRFARTEVDLGGWGNPDECSYFDAAGRQVYVDGNLAGPVLQHPPPVTHIGGPAAIAALSIVGMLGAIAAATARVSHDG